MVAATAALVSNPVKPLRIALVTETYPPEVNGVAMTAERLVRGLMERGYQVQLIRPQQSSEAKSDESKGLTPADFELITVRGVSIPFYRDLQVGLPARRLLMGLWQQNPPDLVHIVTEGPLGASALKVARRLNLPTVSGFHTNFHSYSRYYGFGFLHKAISGYLRRFHNDCLSTLVPTAEMAQMLAGLGIDNAEVLSRGVDTNLFSPQHRSQALRRSWGVERQQPVVLYVGRLAAEKNLLLAVRAFLAFREIQPNARFVLVGAGPLAAKLQARYPEFVFCGVRKGLDLAAHYASADAFLFPSLTETFGNVTLEAMASGLAVVAFDYAAAHQHIKHEHDGLLAPLADEQAFISAAQSLASDLERIRHFGENARQAALPYDWNKIYERLVTIYQNAIQANAYPAKTHLFNAYSSKTVSEE